MAIAKPKPIGKHWVFGQLTNLAPGKYCPVCQNNMIGKLTTTAYHYFSFCTSCGNLYDHLIADPFGWSQEPYYATNWEILDKEQLARNPPIPASTNNSTWYLAKKVLGTSTAKVEKHKCKCEIRDLMALGCKCGGC